MKQAAIAAYASVMLTASMLLYTKEPDSSPPLPSPSLLPSQTETVAQSGTEPVMILLSIDGSPVPTELEEYLVGVVAAEMPASFEPEALRAQAVAARTYALWCMDTHKHSRFDLCDSPACCQAWQSDRALRGRWGADYERNLERITDAVYSTQGQTLGYDGKAIFAAFHSSSAGATESSGEIWQSMPYLQSVSSPESELTVPGYVTTVRSSGSDFRSAIQSTHPEAEFPADEAEWFRGCELDSSGRIACMTIGDCTLSGRELRELFSLRSTAFSLDYSDGEFIFTVTGSGHGVGMSQYGANVMASQGYTYEEILAHYYPGTQLLW